MIITGVAASAQTGKETINDFVNSPEFARIKESGLLSRMGDPDLSVSYSEYLDDVPDIPVINIFFSRSGVVTAVVEAVKMPDDQYLPNHENYAMTLVDYRNYSNATGDIYLYDLNYGNFNFGYLNVVDGKVRDKTFKAPPPELLDQYTALRTTPHFCDKNKNGNVGFWECYDCMDKACRGSSECDLLCKLIDKYNRHCKISMAAACVIISIKY